MRRPTVSDLVAALPDAAGGLVRAVLAEADARELAVYLVGGPVRDLLLGRSFADADLIVGGAPADEVYALAEAAAPAEAKITRHPRFGTATLRVGEGAVDLATVRSETYAHDGALPSVGPGSLEEDLRRRDFSVNALALPLSAAARAAHRGLLDVDEGVADLEKRRLRVLHRRSFHDDPTRALRAARLGPRLGFHLTPGSRSALRDALRDGAFSRVSGERLRRELTRLFDDARLGLQPAVALRQLSDAHVLAALEPGLSLPREAALPLRRLGRAIADPPWRPGRFRPWISGFSLWLAPLTPQLRRRALRRFAVRGEVEQRIAAFPGARDGSLRGLERARGRGAIDALLRRLEDDELFALHASAGAPLRRRIERFANQDRGRRAPISGEDLIAIGLEGPAVGRALARVREAWLDGRVKSRDEAVALARELSRRRSGARATRPRASRRRKP